MDVTSVFFSLAGNCPSAKAMDNGCDIALLHDLIIFTGILSHSDAASLSLVINFSISSPDTEWKGNEG